MKKLKLYLDNCCFNRPFDDQSQLIVQLETEAVLFIQEKIKSGEIELVWSSILDFEIGKNPHKNRRETTLDFRDQACFIAEISVETQHKSVELQQQGLALIDSLHVACAMEASCDYFLTTDKKILNKTVENFTIVNPICFVQELEEEKDD